MFRSGFIKWFVKTMLKGMSFVTGLFWKRSVNMINEKIEFMKELYL